MNSDMPELERIIIGAMSGTSADGVDAAAVAVAGRGWEMKARLLGFASTPFDGDLRRRIGMIRHASPATAQQLCALSSDITAAYATVVRALLADAAIAAADVVAVAAHGQTLFHAPPLSWQIFNPALLAAEVNCAVVSDFRSADLAAGGQGAPLAPFSDYLLFRSAVIERVLVNIGGIANLTRLLRGGGPADVRAFDTGPGNCISDFLMRREHPDGPGCDAGGAQALAGAANDAIVRRVLQDTYFKQAGPKSTDGPRMIAIFEAAVRDVGGSHRPQDLLATAAMITAQAIADSVRMLAREFDGEVIVSGGGIHNAAIMGRLRDRMGTAAVRITDEFGWPSAAKEAVAFALLGAATLDGFAGNLPAVTGARRPAVLGSITPRPG